MLLVPNTRSGTALPTAHSMIKIAKGPMLRPQYPMPAVSTSFIYPAWVQHRVHPGTSCSSDHPEPELIDLPSSPAKCAAYPNDGVAIEALKSTGDHDKDNVRDISEDKANQGIEKPKSGSKSQTSTADSNQESVTGDCLSCSDTEEAAVKSSHKNFCKKVQASCRLARWGLWKVAQMAQISKCHQTAWGSDYRVVKTEWELALNEDYSSFKVNKIVVQTNQLLCIKEATDAKISILSSMMPRSKGERRPWCSHWSSCMHVSGCMRRAWPVPWLACRDFI